VKPGPVQRSEPGAHTPVQTPERQVWCTHATGDPHVPYDVHICTPLPEHCVAPGVHVPEQAPETQAWFTHPPVQAPHPPPTHTGSLPEHAAAFTQLPLESQVWGCVLDVHRACPGPQTPVHAPLTQV
jgi:hypothetical protein